jgi:type IV pilus assembly protein PilC
MPTFTYKAVTKTNTITTGTVTAPSAKEVGNELQKQGLQPISIREEITLKASQSTIPPIERITFCRYVATMLTSGLSLTEGIAVLKSESKHPVMKQILNDILYHLERGQTLSDALSLYPRVFDTFFIALVRAGEISGTMAESFKYLEEELRADYSLSSKIKGALMYPGFIFAAMMGIGGLMIFFIMPQIGKVFLNMSIPIPAATRFMFELSLKIAEIRTFIVIGVIGFIVGVFVFLKQPKGKAMLIKAISPIPVVKGLMQQIDIARFCRIFSTLIASAVPITESLEIALNSLSNPQFARMKKAVVDEVIEGKTIAATFKAHKAFPPLLIQMIAGGEKSGTLDKTLGDLAAFYEEEVEESVKKSTQLLEPMLMLFVGIGVGGMILSIIAPMYSVVGSLSH